MASFLEQIQASVRQLENRIKHMERRLGCLEDLLIHEDKKDEAVKAEKFTRKKSGKSKSFDIKRFELNIGKYFLQVVGVGIFLLGMGFLLKFSIEKGWMRPLVRILFGFISATTAIIIGEYWRIHYKQWAAGCIAGGIVLYYLTFYAAFNLYHIFSLQQAFSGFIVTTIFAALLALWHDSYSIALFSIIGGYLAPVILRVHVFNPVLLSGYILVLALCYLLLSYAKKWFLLSYVSVGFTMLYFSHVLFEQFTINQKIVFLGLTWLIYSFLPYLFAWFNRSKKERVTSLLLAVSAIFVFFGLFYSLVQEPLMQAAAWPLSFLFKGLLAKGIFKYLSVLFCLLNGTLLMSLHAWDPKKTYLLGTLYTLFAGNSIGFIITQWSGYSAIAALSFFALTLFFLSFACRQPLMRIYPYGIWAFCGWRLFTLLYYQIRPLSLMLNEINIALLVIALTFVCAYGLSHVNRHQLKNNEWLLPSILEGAVLALPIYWMHTKIWKFPYHIFGFAWYGLLLFLWGLLENKKLTRHFGYGSCILGMLYFSFKYFMKNLLNPYWIIWLNILFFTFVIVFFVAWLALYCWPHKLPKKEYGVVQRCLDFFLAFFIFAWIRANIILYYDVLKMQSTFFTKRFVGYSIKNDILVRKPFTDVLLTLFYTSYSVLLILIGLVSKKRILRYLGLIIIAMALFKLWIIVMRMPDNIYRVTAFLIIGALLISASFLYQKMIKKV